MDGFANAYDEKVRPLMDKIDQARSLLSSSDDGVTFPNVVVVGDQSSGKSTLLESLSLVELPKGSGIVTRCPLVLRLRKSNQRQVYHLQGNNKKVALDETKINILKYIEEETKKLAGNNRNVVHDLIELQVEDPNVRDLTVVDLPGIAYNPMGDQPKDIAKQTKNLIRTFIRPEGSVILCVFPANVDIATVESIALARELDPEGVRTIGVITKSDLASNPDILTQQLLMEKSDVLQLQLGFVAVRNRSTDEKISLEEARKREKDFFRQHPSLSVVGWDCLGIDALINRLADLYSDRVKETFPKMRSDVQVKLKEVRKQLSTFPPNLETPAARIAKYYELADFYVENILKMHFLSSNDGQHPSMINTLHERFKKLEQTTRKYSRELLSVAYRSNVRNAMSACFGEQLPNFLPHPVLRRLISEKLDQLWCVTDILINDCFRITEKLLLDNDKEVCKNDILLSKLLPTFHTAVVSYLKDKKRAVHNQLEELIRLEKYDPYTMNHYYMDKIGGFKKRLEEQKLDSMKDASATVSPRRQLLSGTTTSPNQNRNLFWPTPKHVSSSTPSLAPRLASTPSTIQEASAIEEQVSVASNSCVTQRLNNTAGKNSSPLVMIDGNHDDDDDGDDDDDDDDDDELMFDSISNDEQAVQDMLISIFSYWKVLTKRFIDYVTLCLRAGCVFDVCSGIRERLGRVPVEQSDFVDTYLAENALVRNKRNQLQQTKERLEKVNAILGGHNMTDIDNDTFTDSIPVKNKSLMISNELAQNHSRTNSNDDTDGISTRSTQIRTNKNVKKTKRK